MEPEPEDEEQAAAAAATEAPDEGTVLAARVDVAGHEVFANSTALDVSGWGLTAAQVREVAGALPQLRCVRELVLDGVPVSGATPRHGDFHYGAETVDADLEAKGKAKEVKKRQQNRKHSVDTRKRKKAKVEGLMQDEARLMERAAGLLADLERGGSTVLDDDGAGAFPEDEERIKALDAAKIREQDEKKKKNLGGQWTRARQALARKVLQRRVVLLENRVAELEKELRARAAAA